MKPINSTVVLALAVAISATQISCGTSCQQIEAARAAFVARTQQVDDPHLAVVVPFALVDKLLAQRVAELEPLRAPVAFGGKLGKTLQRLSVVLRQVRMVPARDDFVAFELGFDALDESEVMFTLKAVAEIEPTIDPEERAVAIALRADSLKSVEFDLGDQAAKRLTDAIYERLDAKPSFLKRTLLRSLVKLAIRKLSAKIYELVREELLTGLGEITRLEWKLPDVPLKRVQLRSTNEGEPRMTLRALSTLPVESGLNVEKLAAAPVDRDQLQVHIAGATMAELGNWAMAEGTMPNTYNEDGDADPAGNLIAGLAWQPGPRPFKIHLWSTDDHCLQLRLGATPQVRLVDQRAELIANDGIIEQIDGPTLSKIGAWFKTVGKDAIEFSQQVAARTELFVAGRLMILEVATASLKDDVLLIGLRLRHGEQKASGEK